MSLTCPITHEPFVDPVIDPEGNTYERAAIVEWVLQHGTSPVTRAALTVDQLVPNRILRGDDAPPPPPPQPEPTVTTSAPAGVARPLSAGLVAVHNGAGLLHICATPPDALERAPLDIALAIDVSYSMQAAASIKTAGDGPAEDDGLSMLDIVKHAVATVTAVLGENDRLSLVAFDTTATVELPLTRMDAAGKAKAKAANGSLHVRGSTNIWDAIKVSLDTLREAEGDGNTGAAEPGTERVATVLLLTDGVPNVEPPRGHVPMLERYYDTHGRVASLSTFGFGYNVDSELLSGLAAAGTGSFAFIPDASFVGTIFVNAISNLLSTMITGAELLVEAEGGALVQGAHGSLDRKLNGLAAGLTSTSWGAVVPLGAVQYGQSRDVVLRVEVPPGASFRCVLKAHGRELAVAESRQLDADAGEAIALARHAARQDFIAEVGAVTGLRASPRDEVLTGVRDALKALAGSIREGGALPASPELSALLDDIEGEASQALRPQFFDKWGQDYLSSLRFAHALQARNNFKDPGVQVYGGALFEKMQDAADDLFMSLPPPTPTRDVSTYGNSGGGGGGSSASRPQVSMASYNSRSGPCFDGGCRVSMDGGAEKAVRDVVAGDAVRGGARVACVVKTVMPAGRAELVELPGGLLVTPWHPVRDRASGDWRFPYHLAAGKVEARPCGAVYSFLLEGGAPEMRIDGTDCVTLGHGIELDPVATHPFFGSAMKVARALSELRGWNEGRVVLGPGPSIRRNGRGEVVGFVQAENSWVAAAAAVVRPVLVPPPPPSLGVDTSPPPVRCM